MSKPTLRALWNGASSYPLGNSMMLRGPTVAYDPNDTTPGGQGDDHTDPDDDDGEATVPKAAHETLVAAHNRLKKDSKADRDELKRLRTEVADLTAELETEKAKDKGGDKAEAVTAVNATWQLKYDKDTKERDDTIAGLENQLDDGARDGALDRGMDDIRVKPELREAVRALLERQIEVERDGEGGRSVTMNSLPLEAALKTWAMSEKGKIFILDGNSGGGAQGGRKGMAGKNPWKDGQVNMTEQARIEHNDPTLATRLKAEAGAAA